MNIPNGYKLVPVEPTEEMMRAGMDVNNTRNKWQVMLAAAPNLPQPVYDEAKERELFEVFASANYVVPPGVGHLFVRSEVGEGYRLSNINHAWHGWLACAKSHAKAGEVGHE